MAFVALPKLPSDDTAGMDYVRLESITVLAAPRRTRDGGSWTVPISVGGQTLSPMFETEEDCKAFYTQLCNQLGI